MKLWMTVFLYLGCAASAPASATGVQNRAAAQFQNGQAGRGALCGMLKLESAEPATLSSSNNFTSRARTSRPIAQTFTTTSCSTC
jgi:hypothetical protein